LNRPRSQKEEEEEVAVEAVAAMVAAARAGVLLVEMASQLLLEWTALVKVWMEALREMWSMQVSQKQQWWWPPWIQSTVGTLVELLFVVPMFVWVRVFAVSTSHLDRCHWHCHPW
jgi:hypothetical protein